MPLPAMTLERPAPAAQPIRMRLVCGNQVVQGKRCGQSLLRLVVNGSAVIECDPCPRCGAVNEFRWGPEGVEARVRS